MTPLITQIESLLPTLHGWCEFPKAVVLARLALAMRPQTVVEIGTWGGRSAFPILLALKSIGHGRMLCIDPWNPQASVEGQVAEADKRWWAESANHELVYQHFIYHIEKLGVGDFVEVRRMKSSESSVPSSIEILEIDGNHGPDALADTIKFAPSVPLHGVCILDDLSWSGGYVMQAEQWLLANGFIKLHPLGTGACYLRTK